MIPCRNIMQKSPRSWNDTLEEQIVTKRTNKSKSNRVIDFTKLPIKSNYASKFHLVQDSIEILGKTMPIIIIDGWEVAIRDCEFKNFAAIVNGDKIKIPYPEQRIICEFITNR